jgi:hypothetical protein
MGYLICRHCLCGSTSAGQKKKRANAAEITEQIKEKIGRFPQRLLAKLLLAKLQCSVT